MSLEDNLKEALKCGGIEFGAVVEVDPVESDYLVTSVKIGKNAGAKPATVGAETFGHSVPAGKSIIQRLEEVADFKYRMKVESHDDAVTSFIDHYVQAICEALAIMKNSSLVNEYNSVAERFEASGGHH